VKIIGKISALRTECNKAARPLVLVPTMGALHAGHAALIRKARQIAGMDGAVAVSIFVNPMQFNSSKDLAVYPRPGVADQHLCMNLGVNILFQPSVKEMYPEDRSVFVEEETLSRGLCGAARAGHFRGVCTVVTKLFHLFAPDAAVFGAKDYQQLAVICRMVRDLNFPIRIIEHPTVREKDGLAMSSRNIRLGPKARMVAPGIYQALLCAQANVSSPRQVLRKLRSDLALLPGVRIDYVECVNATSLESATNWLQPTVIAVAVFLEGVRLIDNIRIPQRKVC
jgi:pantoate--beta-alanine ligase